MRLNILLFFSALYTIPEHFASSTDGPLASSERIVKSC